MNFAGFKLLAFIKYMFSLLNAVNFQDGDMKLTYYFIEISKYLFCFIFFSFDNLVLLKKYFY